MTIDINCDLGEIDNISSSGNDETIIPYITSANIACGLHAGNPVIMERTVLSAKIHSVAIGAHPGYPDREGFGRNPMGMSDVELTSIIKFQVRSLKTITESIGIKLQHVKCHGALYNTAAKDYKMSTVIARCIREIDKSLILVGLAGSELIRAGQDCGLQVASEIFADRAYNDDGTLVSRRLPGAVLHDEVIVIERAIKMVNEQSVVSISGKIIPVQADTICIHGDHPKAPEFAKGLREAFSNAGINIKSLIKKKGDA